MIDARAVTTAANPAQFVILATDDHAHFPLCCLPVVMGWVQLGWQPVVFVLPRADGRAVPRMVSVYKAAGASVAVITPDLYRLPLGVTDYTIACRRLEAWETAKAHPGALVATGDGDMLRVTPLDVPADAGDRLVCYGRNLYEGGQWRPRWPTCYQIGNAKAWGSVLPWAAEDIEAGRRARGRFSDELAFRSHQLRQPAPLYEIDYDDRWRIHRENWRPGIRAADVVDAHFPLNCHESGAWQAAVVPLLAQIFTADQMHAIETFRQELYANA